MTVSATKDTKITKAVRVSRDLAETVRRAAVGGPASSAAPKDKPWRFMVACFRRCTRREAACYAGRPSKGLRARCDLCGHNVLMFDGSVRVTAPDVVLPIPLYSRAGSKSSIAFPSGSSI